MAPIDRSYVIQAVKSMLIFVLSSTVSESEILPVFIRRQPLFHTPIFRLTFGSFLWTTCRDSTALCRAQHRAVKTKVCRVEKERYRREEGGGKEEGKKGDLGGLRKRRRKLKGICCIIGEYQRIAQRLRGEVIQRLTHILLLFPNNHYKVLCYLN